MASARDGKLMAVKVYDYDARRDTFTPYNSIISVQQNSFAHGGMRAAYHGYRHSDFTPIVIKRYRNGNNNRTDTENDVRMQCRCKYLASEYNKKAVTSKKISFVDASVVEFNGGPWDGQFACMEIYLDGSFVKHNCNVPAGRPLTSRKTPQAFSHFTYVFTKGSELVCDLQGVDDDYTDPQIHTNPYSSRYGQGNFGPQGIQIFLRDHHCSDMCRALKLPPTQASAASGFSSLFGATKPNW